MHHLDYCSIPEELTCKGMTFPQDRQSLSRSFEDRQFGILPTECKSIADGVIIDDGIIPTGSKESLAVSNSDDQSDVSDCDSGFSGSNKDCLSGVEQWYDFFLFSSFYMAGHESRIIKTNECFHVCMCV